MGGWIEMEQEQEPIQEKRKLWTVKEAAKELCLSEKTVRRLIKAGTIDARQYGREYRIPHAELTGYAKRELGSA